MYENGRNLDLFAPAKNTFVQRNLSIVNEAYLYYSLPIAKQYGRLLRIVEIKDNLFIHLIFFITVILFLFVEIVIFLILELSNIEKKESL